MLISFCINPTHSPIPGGDAQGMRALFELVKDIAAQGGWPDDAPSVEEAGEGEEE